MNRSVHIEADGIIPVDQSDVSGIPSLALSIPDFEGQAVLRIFGNSTKSEIGCYSAVITNGATFSQPSVVGSALGVFTFTAVLASFATAVYGDHVPTMRTHYAHSLSVFVVFAIFHHIFYTGALSMNWPSVLTAWWSNFAWSAGMFYSESMQNSINQLIGSNRGNTSIVGAAGSGASSDDIGGGYQISQIYKRTSKEIYRRYTESPEDQISLLRARRLETAIAKRALANSSDGFSWYGNPVKPGIPIPGNYSGFAGTLSGEGIPASNAFMTGFLWFLILSVLITVSVVAFKWILEALSKKNIVKTDRLSHFRVHWIAYTAQVALRTAFIGFFMMVFLTLFEFTYRGGPGATAIAVIVFLIFFIGMFGIAGYALFYRLRFGRYESHPDRLHYKKGHGRMLSLEFELESHRSENLQHSPSIGSLPWWRIRYIDEDPQRMEVHQDEEYIHKFGWLSGRFRRTRWWFFGFWIVYEFVRACFYGGAAGHPMTQVFGLLVIEILALIVIVTLKPFEGARLNALMVYLLGFSKVATVALSAAFDARFNLARITTTVIGIVIIVIQGILIIVLLIAIVLGAISTYMSLTRNHENFKPRHWEEYRQKYFAHLEKSAPDVAPPPPPRPELPKGPYFNVKSVRREAKIEDENEDASDFIGSRTSIARPLTGPSTARASRANSVHSPLNGPLTSVPFGARVHRASWSTRDFQDYSERSNRNSRIVSNNRASGAVSSHVISSKELRSKSSNRDLRDEETRTSRSPPLPDEALEIREAKLDHKRVDRLDERPSQERPSAEMADIQH